MTVCCLIAKIFDANVSTWEHRLLIFLDLSVSFSFVFENNNYWPWFLSRPNSPCRLRKLKLFEFCVEISQEKFMAVEVNFMCYFFIVCCGFFPQSFRETGGKWTRLRVWLQHETKWYVCCAGTSQTDFMFWKSSKNIRCDRKTPTKGME